MPDFLGSHRGQGAEGAILRLHPGIRGRGQESANLRGPGLEAARRAAQGVAQVPGTGLQQLLPQVPAHLVLQESGQVHQVQPRPGRHYHRDVLRRCRVIVVEKFTVKNTADNESPRFWVETHIMPNVC